MITTCYAIIITLQDLLYYITFNQTSYKMSSIKFGNTQQIVLKNSGTYKTPLRVKTGNKQHSKLTSYV